MWYKYPKSYDLFWICLIKYIGTNHQTNLINEITNLPVISNFVNQNGLCQTPCSRPKGELRHSYYGRDEKPTTPKNLQKDFKCSRFEQDSKIFIQDFRILKSHFTSSSITHSIQENQAGSGYSLVLPRVINYW